MSSLLWPADRIREVVERSATPLLASVSHTQPFAMAVDAGIRMEAVGRALSDRTRSPLRPMVRSAASRREDSARAERAAGLAYDTAAGNARTTQLSEADAAKLIHWRESGTGPPLVLINGWSVSGLAWPQPWIDRLARSFRVIRVDNRGTGWSRYTPSVYTIADLAHDVVRVMDVIGVERATVLGLSMGGMIAQELALRWPGRVERLFVVGSRPPAPRHLSARADRAYALMAPPPPGVPFETHVAALWAACCAPGFADAHPEALDEIAAQIVARPTPRVFVRAQLRAIMGWSGADRLKQLAVPATVVHGELDELMPVGNGMRIARLIPDARYVELRGVGHLVPHEAPEELAILIEDLEPHTQGSQ
jgi:pimeloyl-ACP methyl ester carboxylesterase